MRTGTTRAGTIRAGLLALLVAIWAVPGAAQTPRQGLLWNRTGLPAVFPLQVKTLPGRNYVVTLFEVGAQDAALAAYIEGGRFFRVLVPPGTYRTIFAAGSVWQGEDALFGPRTAFFELPEPLTFKVSGLRTKKGHLVDLTEGAFGEMAGLRVRPAQVCQTLRLAEDPNFRPVPAPLRTDFAWDALAEFAIAAPRAPLARRIPPLRLEVAARPC